MAATLKDEIEAANVKFMHCYDSGDFVGLSNLYTADCRLMPTGAATLIGKDGVQAVFSSVHKAGGVKVVLEVVEVGAFDPSVDMAYERSQYTFMKENGETFDQGKYLVIWKKIEGVWYLYTDIFNTNTPPSG